MKKRNFRGDFIVDWSDPEWFGYSGWKGKLCEQNDCDRLAVIITDLKSTYYCSKCYNDYLDYTDSIGE